MVGILRTTIPSGAKLSSAKMPSFYPPGGGAAYALALYFPAALLETITTYLVRC